MAAGRTPLPSTAHGVLNDGGADRYAIAYFHSPNRDTLIERLPSCTGRAIARHPPAVYRDLVLAFYRANYFRQKGHGSEAMDWPAGGRPAE